MTESSLVLLHDGRGDTVAEPSIIDFQKGYAAHVEFDFLKIWKYMKNLPKKSLDDLHFIHIHPTGFGVQMSGTDINCLEGFLMSYGISPLFSIIEFDKDKKDYGAFKRATYQIQIGKIMTLTSWAQPRIPVWATNLLWNLSTQEYFPLNYWQKEK